MTSLIPSIEFSEQYFFRVREGTSKVTCDRWTPEQGLLTNCSVALSEVEPFIPSSLTSTRQKVEWLIHHHHFKPSLRRPKAIRQKNMLFSPHRHQKMPLHLRFPPRREIYFSQTSPQNCELINVRSIPLTPAKCKMLEPLTSELLILNREPLTLCNWETGKIWQYENPIKLQVFPLPHEQVLVFAPGSTLAIWDLKTEQSHYTQGIGPEKLSIVYILSNERIILGYADGKIEIRDNSLKLLNTLTISLASNEYIQSVISLGTRQVIIGTNGKRGKCWLWKIDLRKEASAVVINSNYGHPGLFSIRNENFLWIIGDEVFLDSKRLQLPIHCWCQESKKISDRYFLIIGSLSVNKVILVDVETPTSISLENAEKNHFEGDIAICENTLITCSNQELFFWDLKTGQLQKRPRISYPFVEKEKTTVNFAHVGWAKFIQSSFISAVNISYSYSATESEWNIDEAMGIEASPQAGACLTIFDPKKSGKEGTYASFNYAAPTTIVGIAGLDNGCVAVWMHDSIQILAPQINKPEANLVNAKKSPADFEPFKQLATDYQQNGKEEEAYRVYLAAFSNALSFNLNFIARRFFSKALRLKPRTTTGSKISKIKQEIYQKKLGDTSTSKGPPFAIKIKRILLEANLKKLRTKVQSDNHRRKARSLEPYQLYLNQTNDKQEHRYIFQQLVQFYAQQSNEPKKQEYSQKLKESPPKLRKRLLLGEGNFSYTDSILKKHQLTHPNLATAITATEIDNTLYNSYSVTIHKLRERGTSVLYGIDASKIDSHFKGKRFERIHWNCPLKFPVEELRRLIRQFFQAAHSLQLTGDRIHMALAINGKGQKTDDFYARRQIEYYNIVSAATAVGYRLIGKRRFDVERYPDYKHAKTGKEEGFDCLKREFIFEKTNLREFLDIQIKDTTSKAEKLEDPEKKRYKVYHLEKQGPYFECSTDDDTSDYEAGPD